MDNANRWDRDVLTALGALRPDSADEQLPEAAAILRAIPDADGVRAADLQARSARFDKAVSVALLDGSPPAGLADRILASLRSTDQTASAGQAVFLEQTVPGSLSGGISPDAAAVTPASRLSAPATTTSSRWRVVAGVLAIAASIALAVWLRQPDAVLNPDAVLESAREYAGAGDSSPWHSISASKPPQAFPMSAVLSIDPTATQWQPIKEFLGRSGVAYDVTSFAGARATLLVVSLHGGPQIKGLPESPGGKPLTTAGTATIAWQSNSRLYVLVVHGGQEEYRSFFRSAGLA